MADLYKIFNEEGLGGLLPYAAKETSHGYHILIDKIKAGYPLSFIRTQMEAPFIVVKNGTYQALVYTTKEKAEVQAADLTSQKYEPVIEDLPDGKERGEAFLWMFDHGPTHILLDDTLSIPIGELTEAIPDYDGRPTTEHMLRNRVLNGATFYFLQQAAAGYGNMDAERAWTQGMVNGNFLAACINDAANNYPALAIPVNGKTGLLVYSDWRQVKMDHPDGEPACMIVDFLNLRELLCMDPNNIIVFNNATCALTMDLAYLDMIEDSATNHTLSDPAVLSQSSSKKTNYVFGQVSEEDWDTTDPTPDFLK